MILYSSSALKTNKYNTHKMHYNGSFSCNKIETEKDEGEVWTYLLYIPYCCSVNILNIYWNGGCLNSELAQCLGYEMWGGGGGVRTVRGTNRSNVQRRNCPWAKYSWAKFLRAKLSGDEMCGGDLSGLELSGVETSGV